MPDRKKLSQYLRDLLTAQADVTATPPTQMPRQPEMTIGPRTGVRDPAPQSGPLAAVARSMAPSEDTPMGMVNEMLNPLRQGAATRSMAGQAAGAAGRGEAGRATALSILAAMAAPGIPGDEAGNLARAAVRGGKELPMDTPSRMARAAEQGFEQGYYKGLYPYDWRTGRELDVIQRQEPFPTFTSGEPSYEGIAGFLTQNPEFASQFAMRGYDQPAVMPLAYKRGKTLTLDAKGAMAGDMQFGVSGKPFRDAVRSGKFDTIVLKNTKDEGDVTVALKPENIRSRFAKFDPANVGKVGLMGGLAGTIGASAYRNRQGQDEP